MVDADIQLAGDAVSITQSEAMALLADYPICTIRKYDVRALGPTAQQPGFDRDDIAATKVIERRAAL